MLRLQFFDQGGTTPVMRVRDQLTHVLVGMNDDTEIHSIHRRISIAVSYTHLDVYKRQILEEDRAALLRRGGMEWDEVMK